VRSKTVLAQLGCLGVPLDPISKGKLPNVRLCLAAPDRGLPQENLPAYSVQPPVASAGTELKRERRQHRESSICISLLLALKAFFLVGAGKVSALE
tara:strand:- start:292 stop:579 length:288 start_codon:yes stop_codon:yes gene_type:complete